MCVWLFCYGAIGLADVLCRVSACFHASKPTGAAEVLAAPAEAAATEAAVVAIRHRHRRCSKATPSRHSSKLDAKRPLPALVTCGKFTTPIANLTAR